MSEGPAPPIESKGAAGRWLPLLCAAAAYFGASVALTWPLALHPGVLLFGDYGDTRGTVWWIWARTHGLLDAPINTYLGAPFGTPTSQVFRQPITEGLLVALGHAVGEIAALNFFVLLSFPLAAISAFLMIRRLLRDDTAAFFGGLAFGFCPAAVLQAVGGHALYAFNAFVPVFLLALFHNRLERSWSSALFVAASYACISFIALYFGYFAAYVALYFVVFDVLTLRTGLHKLATNYLLCAAFSACFVIPVEFNAILEQIALPHGAIAKVGHLRGFDELGIYSSRFWDFLLPSIDHPVLGGLVEGFVRTHLHGSNVFEQTLYLGWTPIALVLAGAVIAIKGGFEERHRQLFLFFFWGAVCLYLFSLPPVVADGLPTVSFFAYKVAPMFRVYARFGILVNLFVACCAAVTIAHARARMRRGTTYALAVLLVSALAFEYCSVPPGLAVAVSEPPEVYRWLSRQPGDSIVAEYPMVRSDESAYYTYPFWQRVHAKRLVNGASEGDSRAWAFFQRVKDLADPRTPQLLHDAGVRYVIVHTRMYREGPIPQPIKRYYPPDVAAQTAESTKPPMRLPHLRLVQTFGPDRLYTVCSEAAEGSAECK